MADTRDTGPSTRLLGVNPAVCAGGGICAHLAPDLIRADSWGYPILTRAPITGRDLRQANAAVAACPRRALFVTSTRAGG